MLRFSKVPEIADRQMEAVIFFLIGMSNMDDPLDNRQKNFIRDYIRQLIFERVRIINPNADAALRQTLVDQRARHFMTILDDIDVNVRAVFATAKSRPDGGEAFIHQRIKMRCFEIFRSHDNKSQLELLKVSDKLVALRGLASPATNTFRQELVELLKGDKESARRRRKTTNRLARRRRRRSSVEVSVEIELPPQEAHPFFDRLERSFSSDPEQTAQQIADDGVQIERAANLWERKRRGHEDKLNRLDLIAEDANEPKRFHDNYVDVLLPDAEEKIELTVLGDLRGSYSNLKSAIAQASFLRKLDRFRTAQGKEPEPHLVLLGNYMASRGPHLDRVMKTVLELLKHAPDHVHVLRGSMETYRDDISQARFADEKLADRSQAVFRQLRDFYDAMPSMFLCGEILFVHGGVPRDATLKERFRTMASLNDPILRHEMLWSDPNDADRIPSDLQSQSERFGFGRHQFSDFMHRIECHTMVRSHEYVTAGFRSQYGGDDPKLITVFSAGGRQNRDIAPDSMLVKVTPMALTVDIAPEGVSLIPWRIDYQTFGTESEIRLPEFQS